LFHAEVKIKMNALTIVAIVIVGFLAFMLFQNKKANAKQPETNVTPNTTKSTSIGNPEGKANDQSGATLVKRNLATSNLITQDALAKLANSRIGAQGLDIFRDENFTITVDKAFKPIGDADVTNPLSKNKVPLPKGFVGRKVQTFQVTTTNKKTGATKTRIGSAGLVKRLQQNIQR